MSWNNCDIVNYYSHKHIDNPKDGHTHCTFRLMVTNVSCVSLLCLILHDNDLRVETCHFIKHLKLRCVDYVLCNHR